MVEDTAETLVKRWFKEVWDEGCESSIDAMMAPFGVAYGLPGGPIQGPTAFKPVLRMFREALGDLNIEVVRTVPAGNNVAALCHLTGRHTGFALGGEPTNQPVDFWGLALLRVEQVENLLGGGDPAEGRRSGHEHVGHLPTRR